MEASGQRVLTLLLSSTGMLSTIVIQAKDVQTVKILVLYFPPKLKETFSVFIAESKSGT